VYLWPSVFVTVAALGRWDRAARAMHVTAHLPVFGYWSAPAILSPSAEPED
jgi:hypothetical protein